MSESVPTPAAPTSAPAGPSVPARPGSRFRRIILRLLALAIGCLVAAALAEVLVLVFIGEVVKFPRHVVGAPWGLRYNEPGSHYRHKSADGTWYFQINRQGMRADRDFAYRKPPGTKRIVSLGDSFTIGYEVDADQSFSNVLERELRRAGRNVEVLNAGVSGFSDAEACLYVERELIKYDPDLVLVSFYINDLDDNIRTNLFQLQDGRLVPRRRDYVPAGRLGDFLNRNPILNILSERSNAFAFFKERMTLAVKAGVVKNNLKNMDVAAGRAAPANAMQQRLAAAIFDRLYRFLHARGIPLVIQSIPGVAGGLPETQLVDAFPLEYFPTDRPGLYYLPARNFLEPHLGKQPLYRHRSHFHWSPLSHDLSGRQLAGLILRHHLLDTSPRALAAGDRTSLPE